MVKTVDPGSIEFKFQLYHFLAVWLQASEFTSLSLNFLIYKMMEIIVPT